MKTGTNKNPAPCEACGVTIPPGRGEVTRDGKGWHVRCGKDDWVACAKRRHAPPAQGALPGFEGDAPAATATAAAKTATPGASSAPRAGHGPQDEESERARERGIERARQAAAAELAPAEQGSPRQAAQVLADVFCEAAPATKAPGIPGELARLALLDPGLAPEDRETVSRLLLQCEPREVGRGGMVLSAPREVIRELEWNNRRGLRALVRAVRLALEIQDGERCAVEVRPSGQIEEERSKAA